jgi:uncharacterized oligopeptide transporter (OPT) family protein
MPAPSAVGWFGMAQLFSKGFAALPPHTFVGIIVGLVVGIVLTLLQSTKVGRFVPSPFGLGIAMIMPPDISIAIFLGAMIKLILDKIFPKWMDGYSVSLGSGLIVGEAIIGVVISVLSVTAIIQ